MLAFLIRRVLAAIPVLAVVALFVFLLLRLTPGDPAAIIAGDSATPAQLAQIRAGLGLDQPILSQFAGWVWRLAHGNLGTSIISGQPVTAMIAGRLAPTLSLAATTLVLSILVAVPLGVLAAARRGTWIDRLVMALSVLGFSVPVFVVGYVLIQVFAVELRWLPVQGFAPLSSGLGAFAARITLPTIALTLLYMALIARITRTSMLETLGEDYIRTARAKGVRERTVLLGHALRNASVPIVTVIGIGLASLIGGVVVTENVFNLPGLGRLVVDAVLARDYPVIQAVILLTSFAYVLVNLAIDLAYAMLDPRIRS